MRNLIAFAFVLIGALVLYLCLAADPRLGERSYLFAFLRTLVATLAVGAMVVGGRMWWALLRGNR